MINFNQLKQLSLCIFSLTLFVLSAAVDAEVSVKLLDAKKFRDIEVPGQSSSRSAQDVQKKLTDLFSRLSADSLEKDELLLIEVTELDLPGYVEHFFSANMREIRIIKENTPYKLKFNYKLTDRRGEIRLQGDEVIKGFLSLSATRPRSGQSQRSNLDYLQQDIEDWLKQLFNQ